MKKTVAVAALIAAMTLAGIQTVSAHGGRFFGADNYGPGYCGNYDNENRGYTEENQEAFKKFLNETATIRRDIVVKRSELNALLSRDNPDETKASKLTGELYDLEETLAGKAEAAGIDSPYAYGHGPAMMRGYGWGPGRHMMGW